MFFTRFSQLILFNNTVVRPNLAPYRVRTVPFSVFFTVPFFTAIATVTVPFFSLTVGSAKRTEPLILTVRVLVFDREPYRTKMETVIRLLLRTANRTAIRTVPVLVRYGSRCVPYHKNLQHLSIHRTNFVAVPRSVPHQNWYGTDRGAVRGPQ